MNNTDFTDVTTEDLLNEVIKPLHDDYERKEIVNATLRTYEESKRLFERLTLPEQLSIANFGSNSLYGGFDDEEMTVFCEQRHESLCEKYPDLIYFDLSNHLIHIFFESEIDDEYKKFILELYFDEFKPHSSTEDVKEAVKLLNSHDLLDYETDLVLHMLECAVMLHTHNEEIVKEKTQSLFDMFREEGVGLSSERIIELRDICISVTGGIYNETINL